MACRPSASPPSLAQRISKPIRDFASILSHLSEDLHRAAEEDRLKDVEMRLPMIVGVVDGIREMMDVELEEEEEVEEEEEQSGAAGRLE